MPIMIGNFFHLFAGKPVVFGGTSHAEIGSFDHIGRHDMIGSANAVDTSRDIALRVPLGKLHVRSLTVFLPSVPTPPESGVA